MKPIQLSSLLVFVAVSFSSGCEDDKGDSNEESTSNQSLKEMHVGAPTDSEKDSGRLTKEDFLNWKNARVIGFSRSSKVKVDTDGLLISYVWKRPTSHGLQLVVKVTLSNCKPGQCESLDPDEYLANKGSRIQTLPKVNQGDADLIWEAERIELPGKLNGVITHLQSIVKDDRKTSAIHFYEGIYHDGAKVIRLTAFVARERPAESPEQLDRELSRTEAVDAIKQIFKRFGPIFGVPLPTG